MLTSNVIGDIGEVEVSTRLRETGLFIVFLLGGKVPAFENQFFEITKPLNGWMNTYKWFIDAVSTLSSPREFFIEE